MVIERRVSGLCPDWSVGEGSRSREVDNNEDDDAELLNVYWLFFLLFLLQTINDVLQCSSRDAEARRQDSPSACPSESLQYTMKNVYISYRNIAKCLIGQAHNTI